MTEQRTKTKGRGGTGRPKVRRPQPAKARSHGPRVRKVRFGARPVRRRRAPVEVIPSDRWRPMRRVSGVAWDEQHKAEPRRIRAEASPEGSGAMVRFEEFEEGHGTGEETDDGDESAR